MWGGWVQEQGKVGPGGAWAAEQTNTGGVKTERCKQWRREKEFKASPPELTITIVVTEMEEID